MKKSPQDIAAYEKGCRFLPRLNNEIASERNTTYKERFSSLENLVLIMVIIFLRASYFIAKYIINFFLLKLTLFTEQFEHDTVLIPKETSWFGYYPDGAFTPILPANEVHEFHYTKMPTPSAHIHMFLVH